jgi:GNAT superfamily N-acetyltransferase
MVAIRRVDATVTFPLRQKVLRPHETLAELAVPGDGDPDNGHFAAVDGDGEVVGTASVRREPPPWEEAMSRPGWRLRGMATAEGRRSQGIGAAVLAAAIAHVARHGGGLLWCNARVPAVEFYRRAGFSTRGTQWEDPDVGPHVVMTRDVAPDPSGTY